MDKEIIIKIAGAAVAVVTFGAIYNSTVIVIKLTVGSVRHISFNIRVGIEIMLPFKIKIIALIMTILGIFIAIILIAALFICKIAVQFCVCLFGQFNAVFSTGAKPLRSCRIKPERCITLIIDRPEK